jgi:hypothetical protein
MPRWTMLATLVPLLLALGCRTEPAGHEAVPPEEDLAPEVERGLTEEELQRRAREMSPEQAERMGIVDTTIHVETPPAGLDDTVFVP